MSATPKDLWDGVRTLSRQQALLRLAVIAGTAICLASTFAARGMVSSGVLVVICAASLPAALRPDSQAPLVLTVLLCWHWLATVDDPASRWVLPAALGLLVVHVAAAAGSMAPPAARFDRDAWWRWGARAGLVALGTILAWAITAAADEADLAGNVVVTAAAVVTVAAATLWWRTRSVSPER